MYPSSDRQSSFIQGNLVLYNDSLAHMGKVKYQLNMLKREQLKSELKKSRCLSQIFSLGKMHQRQQKM